MNKKKLLTSGYLSLKECKHGIMAYNRHDRYVGKSLETYGEFSDTEFQILEPWCTDAFVMDIGANIGALTIPFARIAKAVIAIEPQPWVADILTTNVCLNNLRNVDILRNCVGEKTGLVTMPISDPNAIGNFGGVGLYGVPSDTKHQHNQEVQILALNDLHLGRVDVVKMDVEGHEEPALRGMEKHLLAHKPVLYVEADREDKVNSLLRYIRSLGYETLLHKPPLFERKNYFDEAQNVFGNIVSINAFCYIPDKHVEVNKNFKIKFKLEPCF